MVNPDLSGMSAEQLEELISQAQQLKTQQEKEVQRSYDDRIERAILFLANRCDGAASRDGQGFNGADVRYGHWLADRIEANKPLLRKWAESGLKMIRKYVKQLERGGLELPDWEEICHQYLESFEDIRKAQSATAEEKPEYRIEFHGNTIAAFSPWDAALRLNGLYKAVSGYAWNKPTEKAWNFPAIQAKTLIDKLKEAEELENFEIAPEIEIAIAEAEQAQLQKAIEAAEFIMQLIEAANLHEPLPNGRTLFEHQKEAVEWLLSHRKGAILEGGILADDMGLGKTCSALVAAKAMVATHGCPVFVICPASLKDNWLKEAEGAGVAIEVYSWAKLPKPLDTQKYLLIADEAHYAQNAQSQRTKALLEMAKSPNCLGFWGLTGTPMKNGLPINLYPLLYACGHPLAENKLHYQRYFCNAHQKPIGKGRTVWDVSGAAHLNELSRKTSDVILRRKKSECLDLPPKIRQIVPVAIEPKAEKEYSARLREYVEDYKRRTKLPEDDPDYKDPDAQALVTLGILRKLGSQYKAAPAIAMAEELLEQGQAIVIFTDFLESAHAIHEALGGEILTGATPNDQRQGIVERFQAGESKVFVGTIKAGGVGLTLTASSYVMMVDRPLTPGDAEQAEDRCNRIGQTQTVNALWLQYGTIDPAIDSLLQKKQDRIDLVLTGKRKTMRGIGSTAELAKALLEIL